MNKLALALSALTIPALLACSDPGKGVTPAKVEDKAPALAHAASGPADKAAASGPADKPTDKPTAAGIAPAPAGAIALSPANTKLTWTGANVKSSHTGTFSTFTGYVVPADDLTKSKIALEIDVGSVDVQPEKLANHLRSDDFFAASKHPKASFLSSSISPNEGGGYTVKGDLNLRGVTKTISFPATLEMKDGKLVAKSEFKINRHDWGVSYKGAEDNLIRDEVVLRFDIAAVK